MRMTNASALAIVASLAPSWRTSSTSGSFVAGLKKCVPTKRDGSCSLSRSRSSRMLEVLVARTASGLILGSRRA
jgi:hypothetical protein